MLGPPERVDSRPLSDLISKMNKSANITEEKETIKRKISGKEKKQKLIDKIWFVINTLIFIISIVMVIHTPSYYPYFNAITLIILLIYRFFEYHNLKWHYYMIEFCYVINLFSILIVLFPKNYYMFVTGFGFGNGPILFTIFVYKFPFAPHSTIKFISLWTHIGPGLTFMVIRWRDKSNFFLWDVVDKTMTLQFSIEYIISQFCLYLIWIIPYYFINFIWRYDYIIENGLENNFIYALRKPEAYGTNKRIAHWGESWMTICFMFTQFKYVLLCSTISFFFYFSFELSILVMTMIFLVAIWNGATYYIDYFSEFYLEGFEEKTE